VIGGDNQEGRMITSPEKVADQLAYIHAHRSGSHPFDVALTGCSNPSDRALTEAFAAAGVTWWLESLHGFRGSLEELLARIKAGPAV
jgi:hypothetical protein